MTASPFRFSVCIFVQRDDDKILTVTNRRWGGFSLPGGKIEPGETELMAAYRELYEETGLIAEDMTFATVARHESVPKDEDKRQWICSVFVAKIGDQEPKQMEDGTVPEWRSANEIAYESLYPRYNQLIFSQRRLAIPFGTPVRQ